MLVFVAAGTLSVILPAGLVLRTFYPTRKLGGFLIAVAIGLYVVLPLSYVFNAMLANSYSVELSSGSTNSAYTMASGMEGEVISYKPPSNSLNFNTGNFAL